MGGSHHPEAVGERAGLGSAESFRLMAEAVVDYAILMLDPNGKVARWNAVPPGTFIYIAGSPKSL